MVLDYSKFANIDVSDDDAPTPPVERYKGPSLEASAYAKRVVERQRKARAKGTAKACVGDDWKDVDDVFKGDAATFEPQQRHGRCIRWGLPVIDPVKALRRRGVVRELYADKPKDWRPAPERQFVNALMRRRKKAQATSGRIELQVEVAAFLQEGPIQPLKPPVQRIIRCDASYSLAQAHACCLAPSLGFTGKQPYAYVDFKDGATWTPLGGKAPGYYERGTDAVERDAHLSVVLDGLDPRSKKLGELLRQKGDTVGYLYGGGEDAFEHTITLVSIVDDENKGVVVVSGVGGCPDEAGGPNNNYQKQVLDRLIACGSQRYAGRRVALQQRCRVFINGDWLAGRVVAHRGAEGEAYHVLLDNDRKVAVRRDAPELIEPEEESDDEDDDRTRLYEDACRARDNAVNYEGRFEPELFGVMAAQARVGRARSRGDGPRGERVCVMCGASKCFACGACGLSAYCGAVCQKRDYGAHYVVCKAARKDA